MSKVIHNPALAKVVDNDATSSTFVIEPLHAGYGNTLGNSLRRVLLSSIRGGAVVAFRIEGATHEFTTVPGVHEDVVDITLNLDAVICTVDDPKKTVVIDLVVEAGRGYQDIETSSKNRIHSDMIAVDAMFSPVSRVRFKVDPTRVGQETNLDKLELTVETDGSLSPREAFEEAAAILVNQYTALAGATTVESAPALGTEVSDDANELNTSIEDLGLSARTANALINNEIRTVHDLVTLSEQDLRELKGFGSKALDEVKDKLAELEL
jgi:DNA-directed RNA polymerase subunit alpha